MREIFDKKNIVKDEIKQIKLDNGLISIDINPLTVSNIFNTFFTNIGFNLAKNISLSKLMIENQPSIITFDNLFHTNISQSDVLTIINKLKYETVASNY